MKLFASLYLDEDVSVLVATLLRARGLDVRTTREEQMLGTLDQRQLAKAVALDRCLVTHNRVDFELLHADYVTQGTQHQGIIIAFRRTPYQVASRLATLLDTVTSDEIANQLLYI